MVSESAVQQFIQAEAASWLGSIQALVLAPHTLSTAHHSDESLERFFNECINHHDGLHCC
jgi:hypothetical protein